MRDLTMVVVLCIIDKVVNVKLITSTPRRKQTLTSGNLANIFLYFIVKQRFIHLISKSALIQTFPPCNSSGSPLCVHFQKNLFTAIFNNVRSTASKNL